MINLTEISQAHATAPNLAIVRYIVMNLLRLKRAANQASSPSEFSRAPSMNFSPDYSAL